MKWYVHILDSEDRVIKKVICTSNRARFDKTKEFESKLTQGQRVCITRHEILAEEEKKRLWSEFEKISKKGTEAKKKFLIEGAKKYDFNTFEEFYAYIIQ